MEPHGTAGDAYGKLAGIPILTFLIDSHDG